MYMLLHQQGQTGWLSLVGILHQVWKYTWAIAFIVTIVTLVSTCVGVEMI